MMNNAKAIYDYIAVCLLELIDNDFVTPILDFLDEQENESDLTLFETVTQKLEEYCHSISECSEQSAVYTQMANVKSDIMTLKPIYAQTTCPVNVDKLLQMVDLAKYILSNIEDLDSDLAEISYSDFNVIEDISDSLSLRSHFYENSTDFISSIAFFHGNFSLHELIDGGLTPNLATLCIEVVE